MVNYETMKHKLEKKSRRIFMGISKTLMKTLKPQTRECALCFVLCAYLTAMYQKKIISLRMIVRLCIFSEKEAISSVLPCLKHWVTYHIY